MLAAWPGALDAFERALAADPGFAAVHLARARQPQIMGRARRSRRWTGARASREVAAAARRIGVTTDGRALADAWRAAYAPSMDRVRKGERPWTTIDVLHRAALDALLPRFGLEPLDEPARIDLNRAWHRLDPWPDSVAGLPRPRHRHTLATLSNGNVSLLANMARQAHLPWDVILSAELFGHYKPDKEVYDGACRLLDLPPTQVMMVAAHNADLRAAAARGLRTAFVARPTEYGPAQTKDLAADGKWDVVCASSRNSPAGSVAEAPNCDRA